MTHFSFNVIWFVQFICAVIVALTLPKTAWPFRIVAGLSALADVVEALVPFRTLAYFYTYWTFREVELCWSLGATCWLCGRHIPAWRYAFWSPLALGIVATTCIGIPKDNPPMQVYQIIMLTMMVLTTGWAYGISRNMHWSLLCLASALALGLQLACTLIWFHWHYNSEMWFIAWITGLVMLWWSTSKRHSPSESLDA